MRKLVLNIEESRYRLLLQFLETLDYVRIDQTSPLVVESDASVHKAPVSQLALLRRQLQNLSTPLFQSITDPIAWQKKQRDEWS
jgi:hypothetical protein